MANEESKQLSKSWAMVGGDGARSYAQNSSYQRGALDVVKEMVVEGVKDKLDFTSPCFGPSSNHTFRIADFGCSVGPNTFFAMEYILEIVEHKYQAQFPNSPPLEFQVFFNDVAANDFNTLFKTLPSYQKYFAAGVPGSFYGRLFPKSTLHLAYSSCALHWLSKVPEEIVDSKSPAWNKGSIQCTGTSKEVAKAYSAQFKRDMDTFLNARAQEIVGGGLVLIVLSGLSDGIHMSQTRDGIFYDFFERCLVDMAKLGVISEEKVDSFNLPVYNASPKEIEEIVEENRNFSIERMESLNHPMLGMVIPVEFAISHFRAVSQGLLEEHFGSDEDVEKIFNYFGKNVEENILNGARYQHTDLFILLKRNMIN